MKHGYLRFYLVMALTLAIVAPAAAQFATQAVGNFGHHAPTKPPASTITGRVINQQNEAIPGAAVSLLPHAYSRSQVQSMLKNAQNQFPTTRSDAQGSFTLTLQPHTNPTIHVRADGYVDLIEPFNPRGFPMTAAPAKTTRTLTLNRQTTLSGIVADENGAPLPGVRVHANPATIIDSAMHSEALESTQTDGDGRFTLSTIPDAPVALRFSCPGFADAWVTTQPGDPVAVNLNRGATVSGWAVDIAGQPMAGIPVYLAAKNAAFSAENQHEPKPFPRQWTQTATSGESGAISFRHVPPGEYIISISNNGQESQQYAVWAPRTNYLAVTVPETGALAPVTVPVYTGYTIKGRVVESGTTTTIPGARVWLMYYKHPYPWTITDAAGEFQFNGIFGQSRIQLAAQAEGYRPVKEHGYGGNTTVTLTAELPTSAPLVEVTIPMERQQRVKGIVLDAATSQPVSGATVVPVEGRYYRENPADPNLTAVTGPDGRFMLETYPGEGLRLRAELSGYAPAISNPLTQQTEADVILALTQGRELRGVVVDPDNKPVAGAKISGSITLGNARSSSGGAQRRYTETIPSGTQSGSDGTFTVRLLPPYADVSILAQKDGFAPSEPASYYMPRDTDITSVTLQLRVAKHLAGRVLSPDGQPLAHANIHVRSLNTSGNSHFFTANDGRYTFNNLPDSPVEAQVHHQKHGTEYFYDIAVGRDNVDFQFGKGDKDGLQRMQQQQQRNANPRRTGAVLYGRVLDYKTNHVIEDYKVTPSYGGTVRPNPDVVGGFIIEGLLVGSPYQTIQITAPGYAPYDSGSLYVMAGQTKIEKTFKLGPGGSITGRAIDQATKQPVPGVVVSLGEDLYSARPLPAEQKPKPVTTLADGTFILASVGQGRKVVSYEPPAETGYIKMTQEVDVIYNEATDVRDVEFGSGGTIKGRLVRMPGSIPIPGARIEARDQNPVTSDAEGAFEFTNLLNGLHYVEAPEYGANSWIGIDKLETKELTLEVGSGTLAGTIMRAGHPVECSIRLQKVGPGQSVARFISSDKAGRFVVEGLAPGRWGVEFTGRSGSPFTAGDYVVMPPSGEDVEKTFTLPSGALQVTVIDAAGQPVPNTAVTVRQQSSADSALQANSHTGTTTQNGIASFDALDGGSYAITALTEDGLRGSKDGIRIENGHSAAETITLKPAAGGTLVSTALNLSSGKPLSTAWCYLFNETGQLFEHNSQRDELGLMTIENIPPGQYRVQVSAFSFSAAERTVTINSGEVQNIQDVLYPAGAVRWVLRDAAGAPVAGAACTLVPADPESIESARSGISDANGLFVARGLMPGAYTATAHTTTGQSATATVNISAANASDVISMVK